MKPVSELYVASVASAIATAAQQHWLHDVAAIFGALATIASAVAAITIAKRRDSAKDSPREKERSRKGAN